MNKHFLIALVLLLVFAVLAVDTGKNYFLGYGFNDFPFDKEPDFNKKYVEGFHITQDNRAKYVPCLPQKFKIGIKNEQLENLQNNLNLQSNYYNDKLGLCERNLKYWKKCKRCSPRADKEDIANLDNLYKSNVHYYNQFRNYQNELANTKYKLNETENALEQAKLELAFCKRYKNKGNKLDGSNGKNVVAKYFLPYPQEAKLIPNLTSGQGINNFN